MGKGISTSLTVHARSERTGETSPVRIYRRTIPSSGGDDFDIIQIDVDTHSIQIIVEKGYEIEVADNV